MGRGKIEIKRIENSSNRQVTFAKRRAGLLKKAREIGVLCDAEVGVVIFSSAGKLYDFWTPKTTLPRILEKYQTNSGKILWDEKHKSISAEIDRVKKENDNMQIELRHMKGEDINSLQPKELIAIEEALQNGQTNLREKMMDHWKMHRRTEKMLEEEHKLLVLRMVNFQHYLAFYILQWISLCQLVKLSYSPRTQSWFQYSVANAVRPLIST
ncbi:MADS-box transcription factor 4-like isoform X1 [Lolium rigidum]|uniref:MADS-box transcription factor 4-like isoform X1 n=1 Tax=Lolium rigidum TaxID=89674 RepID=UPI001F5C9581|nr:MADS-box transcription factor 4-like isoform X1 [Lolium rigidum]